MKRKRLSFIVPFFLALAISGQAFGLTSNLVQLPDYSKISKQDNFLLPPTDKKPNIKDILVKPRIKIMPLGDSITHGYRNDSGGTNVDSYRKPLYDMLIADGYSVDFVGSQNTCEHCDFDADHEGCIGKPACSLKVEVFGLLEIYNPDIVLLHIGTNDLKDQIAFESFDRVEISNDVQSIIDEVGRYQYVYDKHVTVIVAGRIINQAPYDIYTEIFNDYLEHAIAGENLILVDMENDSDIDYRLTENGGDMRDRLHPNSSGYEKMANVWHDAIKEYLTDPLNNWYESISGTSSYLYDVDYSRNSFIAVGQNGTVLTSSNGQNWTSQYSGTTNTLFGITDSSSKSLAVGSGGTIVTSSDRINWNQQYLGDYSFTDVTFGENLFVAVGYEGTIFSSLNGEDWSIRNSGTSETLRGIAYGNGTFIVVGNNGIILRSFDGISWNRLDSRTSQHLNDVTYGDGEFVAVGLNATILKSYNGTNNWLQCYYTGTTKDLFAVTYGSDAYVAVGQNGALVSSHTAEHWSGSIPRTTNYLIGVAHGLSNFVAVGGYGTILHSAAISPGTPYITSPANGDTLSGSAQIFNWANNGENVDEYWLWVGSYQGGHDYDNSGSLGTATSYYVEGLPTDGSTVWVRFAYNVNGTWYEADFSYTAAMGAIRIMPLGDSITQGITSGVDIENEQVSYRKTLRDLLVADGYSIDFVGSQSNGSDVFDDSQHEGHPGWTAQQILLKINEFLTDNPPDIVLLHIGTNNMNWGYSPEDTAIAVEQILDGIDNYEWEKGVNIIVVLALIINQEDYECGLDSDTTEYNNLLEDMARLRIESGDRLEIVNMECDAGIDYRRQPVGDMWDDLHPFETGYEKMAWEWYYALYPILFDGI